MGDQKFYFFCNGCGRETDHEKIRYDENVKKEEDGGIITTMVVARCRGCSEYVFNEKEIWYDNWDPDGEGYVHKDITKPDRLWKRPPEWLKTFDENDADLKPLLEEVYTAANPRQSKLLAMGVRAVLDHVMIKVLGSDIGGFEQKLDEMVLQGHLTKKQRENLEIVIDAGSACTHRGYLPPGPLLEQMVAIMEIIIQEHYIASPMLQTLKKLIPPRPPRPKKADTSVAPDERKAAN